MKLLKLIFSIFLLSSLQASSLLKVVCDRDNEKIYLDGKFKTECNKEELIRLLISPGRHIIKIVKYNKDESYYNFMTNFKISNRKEKIIEIRSNLKYPEKYYYQKALKSIKYAEIYLKKYPHGQYIEEITKLLSNSWQKTYGGNEDDVAKAIVATNDGGYIIVGYTKSFGAGKKDVYIIKINNNGQKLWQKTYGGSKDDVAKAIVATNDNGYIIVGDSKSFGNGLDDVYVIKIDNNGNKIWEKTFGSKFGDYGNAIVSINNGEYIITGSSFKNMNQDVYVIKIDNNGNKLWEKIIGTWDKEELLTISSIKNNSFVSGGYRKNYGWREAYFVKMDIFGHKIWSKTIQSRKFDIVVSLVRNKDNTYLGSGCENWGNGEGYIYLVKIDNNGKEIWKKTYYDMKGSFNEATSIIKAYNGYIIVGNTVYKNDTTDIHIMTINEKGKKINENFIGGKKDDMANSIIFTKEGGCIVIGFSNSFGNGKKDFYVIKISKNYLNKK